MNILHIPHKIFYKNRHQQENSGVLKGAIPLQSDKIQVNEKIENNWQLKKTCFNYKKIEYSREINP